MALTRATGKTNKPQSFEFSPGASGAKLDLYHKRAEQYGGVRGCPAVTEWAIKRFILSV